MLQNLPKIVRLLSCGAVICCHIPIPSAFTAFFQCLSGMSLLLICFKLVVAVWDLGMPVTLKSSY